MAPTLDSEAVWFVTGCSSGIGKSLATHIHNSGHNLVATARNLESLSYLPDGPKVLKLQLDVCSKSSIDLAFETLLKRFNRLDVVINNAGYESEGEAEGFPDELAREQLETNFWGPVRITKESIRIFREVNAPGQGGTIIQMSSLAGFATFPGHSFYHASKFALEGFSKSVNKELIPAWNIKIMIAAPGGVNTNFFAARRSADRLPAYSDNPEAPLNGIHKFLKNLVPEKHLAAPEKLAATLFDVVVGQKERLLPLRLSLGPSTLDFLRKEIDAASKEVEDWKEVTCEVTPAA